MTIFAGLLSRRNDGRIPDQAMADLKNAISRMPGDNIIEHSIGNCFVVNVDIGAYGDSGCVVDEAGLTLVTGDPVLKNGSTRSFENRKQDVESLHRKFDRGDVSTLRTAAGTFAGLHIPRRSGVPFLFVDKLGLRQLFVAEHGEFFAFSTALRVLERLRVMPKVLDYEGLTEQAELHWPLGRRTPYRAISLLAAAEILYLGDRAIGETYWSWPKTTDRGLPLDDHLHNVYERFTDALHARLAGDDNVLAFLSGGLDSRSIVAGLHELGKTVHAINYAPEGTQDRMYAKCFAQNIGCDYLQIPFSPKLVDGRTVHTVVREFVEECCARGQLSLDRPSCIWTGNGGSVGLGHVYMTEALVAALENGDYDLAIRHYRKSDGMELTQRPLSREFYEKYRNWPHTSLKNELRQFEAAEPGRAFYHFLMVNDQRRSLHPFFEDMDLHRLEFLMPFFDSDFLEAVSQVPIDECLYHKFYVEWMSCFGRDVTATPWQSYPGHVACPVQGDPSLGYQFDSGYSVDWSRGKFAIRLKKAQEMATARRFPNGILSRFNIVMSYLFALARSERLGYSIEKGFEYFRYWQVANGRKSD